MSSLAWPMQDAGAGGLRHLWQSWRSLRLQELMWFLLMALFYGLIDLAALAYVLDNPRWPLALVQQFLVPLVVSMVLMLAWLPASRSAPDHPRRLWRLALATLLGSVLSMLVFYALIPALDLPSVADLARERKGDPPYGPPPISGFIGECLSIFVPSLLSVSLLEFVQRRRLTQARLQQLLHEQSAMQRRALAARLAALQAQVEPQFLFDTLVDVEQAYARNEARAPEQMERLIRHLRLALPRLRDSGGTLESEAALLDSYLAVVAGRQRHALSLSTTWAPELAHAPLPPMLLLPLAQLMLQQAISLPGRCRLQAEAGHGCLRVRLGFDRGGLAADDAQLSALTQRLASLHGGPARLQCRSNAEETEFLLELPR